MYLAHLSGRWVLLLASLGVTDGRLDRVDIKMSWTLFYRIHCVYPPLTIILIV